MTKANTAIRTVEKLMSASSEVHEMEPPSTPAKI